MRGPVPQAWHYPHPPVPFWYLCGWLVELWWRGRGCTRRCWGKRLAGDELTGYYWLCGGLFHKSPLSPVASMATTPTNKINNLCKSGLRDRERDCQTVRQRQIPKYPGAPEWEKNLQSVLIFLFPFFLKKTVPGDMSVGMRLNSHSIEMENQSGTHLKCLELLFREAVFSLLVQQMRIWLMWAVA